MIEEIENGCLGVWEKNSDFILDWESIDWLPDLFEQDDIFFEYNQNNQDWSKKSCTIFNAMWAVSDLWNYEFSLGEIKEMDDRSYKPEWGRVKWYWWETQKACELVTKRWNGNKELVKRFWKIAFYRISMRDDDLVWKVLNKKYTICWWYKGNSAYQRDYREDAILDGSSFGDKTYSHSTALRKIDWVKKIKDSYKWRTYNWRYTNLYEIKPTCREEINGGTFFYWGYVFTKVKEDNYKELIRLEKVRVLCNNALQANSALWDWTNDKVLQNKLHDVNEYIRKNNLRYIEEKVPELS